MFFMRRSTLEKAFQFSVYKLKSSVSQIGEI